MSSSSSFFINYGNNKVSKYRYGSWIERGDIDAKMRTLSREVSLRLNRVWQFYVKVTIMILIGKISEIFLDYQDKKIIKHREKHDWRRIKFVFFFCEFEIRISIKLKWERKKRKLNWKKYIIMLDGGGGGGEVEEWSIKQITLYVLCMDDSIEYSKINETVIGILSYPAQLNSNSSIYTRSQRRISSIRRKKYGYDWFHLNYKPKMKMKTKNQNRISLMIISFS